MPERDTIRGVQEEQERATTSAELRAHNLARLLRAVHDSGGEQTRAQLTRQLNLARGTATVLVRELAGQKLIEELQAPLEAAVQRSRGRPTGIPSAHPEGPVALAVDLRDDSFSIAAFELTGKGAVLEHRERETGTGTGVLAELAERLKEHSRALGQDRVVGTGVAVPSPVSDGRMVQPTLLDWRDVDVAQVLTQNTQSTHNESRVLIGNDATLAGLAEARRGGLRGFSVALHLHIATGIGGVLLASGRPMTGAYGAAGEFGHMPLTGGDKACRCGSVGCWELDAGTRGLLSHAGYPEEGDRMEQAARIIEAAGTDKDAARALSHVAEALGRGIGSLVNAHDPEAVGLSGLAKDVYQSAPDVVYAGYLSTLMRFRRTRPPQLVPSRLGDLGTLTGAAELVFDDFLTPRGLNAWRGPETYAAASET